jgi:filamentous hemagglutinin family protein
MFSNLRFASLYLLLFNCFSGAGTAMAQQVLPDASLGSTVNRNGSAFTIIGGQLTGEHLFHSFQEFSIPMGGSAIFDLSNTPSVTNVFSRVTGNTVSDINGLIRTIGGNRPNLFLLNPNGIVFGENAALNIGGSFMASTATRLTFSDGAEFGRDSAPLLTMSVPIGLQFGQTAAPIVVRSKNPGGEFGLLAGLQIRSGRSLALIGGNVSLEQSGLRGVDGRIEIGAVAENQQVRLSANASGLAFDYGAITAFRDITLSETSAISTSGASGGSIHLHGQNITLQDGSVLLANTLGSGNGGGIIVNATASVDLLRMDRSGSIPSGLFSQVFPGGTGAGGSLIINSPILRMIGGAQAGTGTFGAGKAGDVIVRSQEILAQGISLSQRFNSGLRTTVLEQATGDGGDLIIDTQRLQVLDGAQIGAGTFAAGRSGNLTVNATDIEIAGSSPGERFMSGIFTQITPIGSGKGGDLGITTQRLLIRDGGVISADTLGMGDAGNLRVKADQVSVIGVSASGRASSRLGAGVVATQGFPLPKGNGASVSLDVGSLLIAAGGQVTTATEGNGNAGSILVNADRIEVTGTSQLRREGLTPSRLAAASNSDFAAGSVLLRTNQLEVRDGGEISVSGRGNGKAGDLMITAQNVKLQNDGKLNAEVNFGDRGNIAINTDLLLLRQGSSITTNASDRANGGNISINSPLILGLENSDISANAKSGSGGSIQISTQGLYGLEFRDRLTSESDITASSDFGVSGTVQVNNVGVDPSSGLAELPVDTVDPSQKIAENCPARQASSFVITGRGGMPDNPSLYFQGSTAWRDVRSTGQLENPEKAATNVPPAPLPIEAMAWHKNTNGEIELVAQLGHRTNHLVNATCVPK